MSEPDAKSQQSKQWLDAMNTTAQPPIPTLWKCLGCGETGDGDPPISHECKQPAAPAFCRDDGRCQYAIDHGAEGMGHCPDGKCVQPAAPDCEVIYTVPVMRELSDSDLYKLWLETADSGEMFPIKYARAVLAAARPS